MTRKETGIVTVVIALAMGCADHPTDPRFAVQEQARAARAPGISTVALVVTVSDVDGSGNSYGIKSDGKGVYTNGVSNVEAVLDSYGTFAFNTNTKHTAVRWVSYNFNNPVDPANTYRPTPSNLENYHFSTGPSAYSPFIPIQNLGVNGNPASECMYMGNSVANSSTQWRVSFHKGFEDVANSQSSYAVVTRTSVTPAIWTVSPSGACSPVSNVASLRSGDSSILYGYYYLPFFFTLKAK
jgi:hypothetical protein